MRGQPGGRTQAYIQEEGQVNREQVEVMWAGQPVTGGGLTETGSVKQEETDQNGAAGGSGI